MKIYEKHMRNVNSAIYWTASFGKITRLNTFPFLSKSTINYLQIGTKIVVTYIVDTCNRALWKNKVFICFTMCLAKNPVIYCRVVYVHFEWTYVGWEFVSIPNGHMSIPNEHMSDGNLCPFQMDICRIGIYVHSEWTCMSDWNHKDNQVITL
jgi:hypothetical protein